MKESIYFADVELPFHVWVRESTDGNGYRWVLREAPRPEEAGNAPGAPDPPADSTRGQG